MRTGTKTVFPLAATCIALALGAGGAPLAQEGEPAPTPAAERTATEGPGALVPEGTTVYVQLDSLESQGG